MQMKKLGDFARSEHGAEVVRCHGRHLTFLISRSVGCWTVLGLLGLLGATGGRATWMLADRLVWSIEVLEGIVASAPLWNNPYLGQDHWYGDPVA